MSEEFVRSGLSSDSQIAKRFKTHIKTIKRWRKRPELGFPRGININGRTYSYDHELDEFERAAAVAHASKPSPKT
jgi:hypothetical protein